MTIQTPIGRRGMFATLAAVSAALVTRNAIASRPNDPVMDLDRELKAALVDYEQKHDARTYIEHDLGREVMNTYCHTVDDATAQRLGFGWLVLVRKSVTLDAIRRYNRDTESVISDPAFDAENRAEYDKRRAEGRARVRWWVAETRRKLELQQAAGWPEASRAAGDAHTRWTELEDRLVLTPATSLPGVYAKLEVLDRQIAPGLTVTGQAFDDLDWDAKVLVCAARDIAALCPGQ